MNYYEQFYDDLEFEPEDYGRRDSHFYPREDPYRGDPYRDDHYMDDPYYHDDPYYRGDRDQHRHDRELPEYHQHREEYGVSSRRGGRPPRVHNPDHHNRGRGRMNSNRGHDRGRGSGTHAAKRMVERGLGISDRGRGSSERGRGSGDRGRGFSDRGRGLNDRGHRGARGGMKSMTFVKASSTANASSSKTSDGENKGGSSDQIRFDYKAFQNEPSQVEKEVEQALKAYKCQLGFGYGYGPRSDLVEGEQPEWLIGDEGGTGTPGLSATGTPGLGAPAEESTVDTCLHTAQVDAQNDVKNAKLNPKINVKTAMVNPAFNFVKAKSEFHSIDVAFHEQEKVQDLQPTPNSLSVNFGNKRVGLGFGVSATKNGQPVPNISTKFHAGMKGGTNAHMDARFARLQESVKAKNLPNKNAIEIMHMAVDKVKMAISDDIFSSGRTPTGQPMFVCKLIIDGVSIAQGQATAKKAAKHEAYHNALKVFGQQSLTVKEVSKDMFELRQKNIEFKVPAAIQTQGQKPNLKSPLKNNTSTSKSHNTVSKATPHNKNTSGSNTKNTPSCPPTYTKPKIVFHQPSHPLNDKPLEFQGGASKDGPTGSKNAEALAMKLLNFVKEGQTTSSDDNKGTTALATTPGSRAGNSPGLRPGHSPGSRPGTSPGSRPGTSPGPTRGMKPNPRKRPSQTLYDASRVKARRMGQGEKHHDLEDLSEFIIVDSTGLADAHDKPRDVQILHGSANFNRVILKLEYEESGLDVSCSLMLGDIVVSIAHGENKEEAKANAGKEALEYLRECCYTIKVKQQVDSDAAGLTKEQLLSDIQKSEAGGLGGGGSGGGHPNAAIPDSNIGNLLLRKMGWVGGGVGKDGKGRAEPVQAEMIIGREGLGLSAEKGLDKNFNEKVSKLLQDYIKSDDQRDLHFSSELSKEERAVIHKMGQKHGLKTQSKGSKTKDNDRYLIVSRKRSAKELLEHVKGSGGSTSKYELIPPTNPDFDVTRREDICHGHYKM